MESVSKMPMWPLEKPETEDSESEETENVRYVVSGGFQCPKCKRKLDETQNVAGLADQSCPGCLTLFKPYVEKYLKVKQRSEEARMLVESGHFGRIHDAIMSTGIYIQILQSFVLFPNLELLSTIVHLAHFFLLETIV